MRKSGILMHISSLPSPWGIGTIGTEAYGFIDFLAEAGQHYWQLLPVSPTGYGDSPYQPFSSFAGNPYFIDLDMLEEQGFLKKEEYSSRDWGDDPRRVDYGKIYNNRYPVLDIACQRFLSQNDPEFDRFCLENSFWLEDYALFTALKNKNGGIPWTSWEDPIRLREPEALEAARNELSEEIAICKATQFFFDCQWRKLRSYASEKGVELIGDIPIYVAPDSSDIWASPELFMLDNNRRPALVAGCPPDGFSADGQLWGNPLYDWDAMEKTGFSWWVRRIEHQFRLYDVLRIDHFRGLDSFYAIPAGDDTARNGKWLPGPGMKLFNSINEVLGPRRIIAEDLGFTTDSVIKLLEDSGYPGMKVLQFAFDSREESDYLPHHFIKKCVAYTGTHDNDTIKGWYGNAAEADVKKAREYMRVPEGDDGVWAMLATLWESVADYAIACTQDLLCLGSEARMNTPGVLYGNWQWRLTKEDDLPSVAPRLRRMTELYGRL